MSRTRIAVRFSFSRVSGRRNETQVRIANISADNIQKMVRHGPNSNMNEPTEGANIGTMMNTIMMSDMMRAIVSPRKQSRTIDTTVTRHAAAKKPAAIRAPSIRGKLSAIAAMTVIKNDNASVETITGRRPKWSDKGP